MRAAELRSRILWASRAAHCARSIASALVLAIATGSCTPFDRETEGAGDRSVAPVDAGSLPASRSPTLGFDALEIREVLEAAGFKCAGTKIAPVPGWSCSFVELDGTSYAVQADVDPSGTVTTLTATGSAAGSLLDEQPVRDFFRYLVGRLRPGATLPAVERFLQSEFGGNADETIGTVRYALAVIEAGRTWELTVAREVTPR